MTKKTNIKYTYSDFNEKYQIAANLEITLSFNDKAFIKRCGRDFSDKLLNCDVKTLKECVRYLRTCILLGLNAINETKNFNTAFEGEAISNYIKKDFAALLITLVGKAASTASISKEISSSLDFEKYLQFVDTEIKKKDLFEKIYSNSSKISNSFFSNRTKKTRSSKFLEALKDLFKTDSICLYYISHVLETDEDFYKYMCIKKMNLEFNM
jgi:hypothetical protein